MYRAKTRAVKSDREVGLHRSAQNCGRRRWRVGNAIFRTGGTAWKTRVMEKDRTNAVFFHLVGLTGFEPATP